jgi:hypothetical protein
MKEHKIEILCQMEYEDWHRELEEAGPGWKPLFDDSSVVLSNNGEVVVRMGGINNLLTRLWGR